MIEESEKKYSLGQVVGFVILAILLYYFIPLIFYGFLLFEAKFKDYAIINNPYNQVFNIYFKGKNRGFVVGSREDKSVRIEELDNGVDFYIYKIKEPDNQIIFHCRDNAGCKDDYSKFKGGWDKP